MPPHPNTPPLPMNAPACLWPQARLPRGPVRATSRAHGPVTRPWFGHGARRVRLALPVAVGAGRASPANWLVRCTSACPNCPSRRTDCWPCATRRGCAGWWPCTWRACATRHCLPRPGRELWLVQLWHAMDDAGLPPGLRADYWNWAEPLSVHLLTPQARHAGLSRYPYDTVRSWFLNTAPLGA